VNYFKLNLLKNELLLPDLGRDASFPLRLPGFRWTRASSEIGSLRDERIEVCSCDGFRLRDLLILREAFRLPDPLLRAPLPRLRRRVQMDHDLHVLGKSRRRHAF